MRNPIRSIFGVILLLLFALLLLNSMVYWHSHKLHTGETISHAHPYHDEDEGAFPAHTHSEGELWLLDLIATSTFQEVAIHELPVSSFPHFDVPVSESQTAQFYNGVDSTSSSYRGPPVI